MQRLVDLTENFRVYAVCVPCGRMEPLDLDALVSHRGRLLTVADLRARLRCRICRQRTHDLRIIYVGPKDRPVVAVPAGGDGGGYSSSVASRVRPKPLTPT
jgi:hypothetical protein